MPYCNVIVYDKKRYYMLENSQIVSNTEEYDWQQFAEMVTDDPETQREILDMLFDAYDELKQVIKK